MIFLDSSSSSSSLSSSSDSFAARASLSLQEIHRRAPTVFAEHAAQIAGARYVFISTRDIVTGLMDTGLEPTAAQQTRSRSGDEGFARHMLHFKPMAQALSLADVLGEIVLINPHDARNADQLRAGLFCRSAPTACPRRSATSGSCM